MGKQAACGMQASWVIEEQHTQNEGNLDLGQVQEVLGNVDGYLVQESRGDVESVLNVVQVAASLQSNSVMSCS